MYASSKTSEESHSLKMMCCLLETRKLKVHKDTSSFSSFGSGLSIMRHRKFRALEFFLDAGSGFK